MSRRPIDLDLHTAVAHGLFPDLFCQDRLGFTPDRWQAKLLRSRSRQIILCTGRQVGKSTTVAAMALHTALYQPASLILVIAPSQRQSRELFIRFTDFCKDWNRPRYWKKKRSYR